MIPETNPRQSLAFVCVDEDSSSPTILKENLSIFGSDLRVDTPLGGETTPEHDVPSLFGDRLGRSSSPLPLLVAKSRLENLAHRGRSSSLLADVPPTTLLYFRRLKSSPQSFS